MAAMRAWHQPQICPVFSTGHSRQQISRLGTGQWPQGTAEPVQVVQNNPPGYLLRPFQNRRELYFLGLSGNLVILYTQ